MASLGLAAATGLSLVTSVTGRAAQAEPAKGAPPAVAVDPLKSIPLSKFAVGPSGRDPFNPKAPLPGQTTNTTSNVPQTLNPEETVQFKGVTGTGANRVALINNVPMRLGEKAKIVGSDGVTREWELVDILDDVVVLKLESKTYRRKIVDKFLQFDSVPDSAEDSAEKGKK